MTIKKRRTLTRATDFPVVIPLRVQGDRFLIKTLASRLDEIYGPEVWTRCSAHLLSWKVYESLDAKVEVGEIACVESMTAELKRFAALNWYVYGIPGLTEDAVQAFYRRYPDRYVADRFGEAAADAFERAG